MPWLTPDSIPEDDTCRPLSIPSDSIWLALVSGALTELTQKYNWQQFGSLTVDETVAKMQEIVDSYYAGGCGCALPDGGHIIRIGAGGHLEELGDNGEWGDPTGDYIIPPPAARTDGTAPDQNCLAAKNAVNVLEQLYENLSESWGENLSEAEAGTEFIIALVAIVGFEFAPITFGIVAFFQVVFAALYTALEYLSADLWDESFSEQMTCFLLNCASNVDGVVTFDYDCLMLQLNSLTDNFGLTELQLRLYLQVTYILYFIGGIDGLNLAGRTTAITDDTCSCGWCYQWDLTHEDILAIITQSGWSAPFGNWAFGGGYEQTLAHNGSLYAYGLDVQLTLPEGEYDTVRIDFDWTSGSSPIGVFLTTAGHEVSGNSFSGASVLSDDHGWSGTPLIDIQAFTAFVTNGAPPPSEGQIWLMTLTVTGHGLLPEFVNGHLC